MDPIKPLIIVAFILIILERIIPDQTLPKVKHWWYRVVFINLLQIAIVILVGNTWENTFQKISLFNLGKNYNFILTAFVAYFVITFVFYWWHRFRHDFNIFWLCFHQIHHSPQRIETVTSFYKHPLEILVNSIIISLINYSLLGLTVEAGALVTILTGLAEFFYHMNIATARWIGYFFQRPEMHRIHHQKNKHYSNFSDLPLWDILFRTYKNPKTYQGPFGFKPEREACFWKMFFFQNVNNPIQHKTK